MKIVVTGSAGHISKPLTEKLLQKGHEVSVIGRSETSLRSLVDKGAIPLTGSVEDVDFLKSAFKGAEAVYTMVPPKWDISSDWKGYIGQIGRNYADAIAANRIGYVVNLSSVGAHRSDGCGPVSGLHKAEQALNELSSVNILHLRPCYFYSNFLSNVGMVKNMHILGGNYGGDDSKMLMSDTDDIASLAFAELNALNFSGHTVVYTYSDARTTEEIANVLGTAVGQPGLPWVVFSDEQTEGALLQMGLPGEIAKNYTEMGAAMRSGIFFEDIQQNPPSRLGKTKLEDFSKIFAAVYDQQP